YARMSSPHNESEMNPAAYHANFHDLDRHLVVDRVRKFIHERFAEPATRPSLLNADQVGYTRDEYERLKSRGGMKFAVARAGLKTAGRLSRGVDLGWRSGFDSGLSLDYVYENKPRGASGVGRLIDRSYLNSIGWRGIRQRKANLKNALRKVIEKLHHQELPVRILDIAAGAGRYVIETMQDASTISTSHTNRPWHPQVEFIARVLRNREGQPWIMRRRTTAEIDELVRVAGFQKVAMEVDQWGMFTVSIAQRPEP